MWVTTEMWQSLVTIGQGPLRLGDEKKKEIAQKKDQQHFISPPVSSRSLRGGLINKLHVSEQ